MWFGELCILLCVWGKRGCQENRPIQSTESETSWRWDEANRCVEDTHLLYTLQLWLSGRGMSFFRHSSAVTVLYSEQACVYTDHAVSGGRGVGRRWKPLGTRMPITSCESLHSYWDVLRHVLHGTVSKPAFSQKRRHRLNRHFSETVGDNVMKSLCIILCGSRVKPGFTAAPHCVWGVYHHTGHGAITGWSKAGGSEDLRCLSWSIVTIFLFWQGSITVEESVKRKLLDTFQHTKNFLSCHQATRYTCLYFLGYISALTRAKEAWAVPVFRREPSPASLLRAVALAAG